MKIALVVAATLAVSGCSSRPLHLRPDISITAPSGLRGQSVSLMPVVDLRAQPQFVGRHRDGWARITQWQWLADPAICQSAEHMLRNALAVEGATVVPPDEAGLHLSLEILEADVTDDGFLAGEETFGHVSVRLVVTNAAGAIVSDRNEELSFADPHQPDPGLLGAALYEVVVRALSTIELPPPTI